MIINKRQQLLKIVFLLQWIQFLCLFLLAGIALYVLNAESSQSFRTFLSIFIILLLSALSGLKYYQSILCRKIIEPLYLRPDPVILLTAVGIDLEDFSHAIQLSLGSFDDFLRDIERDLADLNQNIASMGNDIGTVYTIVSKLANEEVTLMDAVGKMSEEIDIMFSIVNLVIDEIDGRNKTMRALVERSSEGGKKVSKTSETIERLSESSGGILKLIDYINGVSKETNLLAINASIEATHSGSEGKGFTVIADEIRKLATQTAQNAREITKLLSKNISDYSLASEASNESGEAFVYISEQIKEVHGTIAEVVQSISELKTRGNIILSRAKSLDEIAARVRDTSGEVYGEVITINQSLEEAQTLSEKISKECKEMAEAKNWLNRLTNKMQDRINQIRVETDAFIQKENKS
ncbi:MAG: methyl-accepting chemotaxis protein [Leptospira sp.]|nr:methyl-accepting chemotaxis protein [Leptospira sp.]